jgi:hypothetical protein
MPDYRRAEHRAIGHVLAALNAELLAAAGTYFGGGTYLAMTLGEYRVSRDVDFLCSSRSGFRMLREEVSETSLGRILRKPLELVREVRADRDGIRTIVRAGETRVKFEIVFEGRIDLAGAVDQRLALAALSPEYCLAEKLLANADRGLDYSTLSRDLIDLASRSFTSANQRRSQVLRLPKAHTAPPCAATWRPLSTDVRATERARNCIKSLAIEDTTTLRKGLRTLRSLL